ncbi:endonuclease [Gardnerella vaginalis]|uniref:Endonuclease NucS n=1 Tax=Gardnerella piotii TaxID=2792977 RepID=A0ABU5MP63_9BIFI|nr:endonuclease NucS [Gardnerella piotii]MDZ7544199.1 endonuclease NucS [Gardnerella piotii]MDZ7552434.1 endonuclease NucS [Gardnerella piotii]RFT26090.1 endonuclease [Gardnerella vaginalis]
MRIIVADCSAEYTGRLNASLPTAKRVLLIKEDGSVLIFSEIGSYKPLNWMVAPCTMHVEKDSGDSADSGEAGDSGEACESDIESSEESNTESVFANGTVLKIAAKKGNDILRIVLQHVYSDSSYDLGEDPGLIKDGVEEHLQHYLAEQIERIGKGAKLVRREYPTAIGPVDIMAKDSNGVHVAIEIKRNGGIDGVEQLTRYCELLNRDPLLKPVRGIFAAQTISPQARVLAQDRGFTCLILDYDDMRGADSNELRLF